MFSWRKRHENHPQWFAPAVAFFGSIFCCFEKLCVTLIYLKSTKQKQQIPNRSAGDLFL